MRTDGRPVRACPQLLALEPLLPSKAPVRASLAACITLRRGRCVDRVRRRVSSPAGVVRAVVEEWWNDLKRAHFIDHSTRLLTLTVPFSSNNAGVRSRVTFFFEMVSTGGIITSYDVLTRVARTDLLDLTRTYSSIALIFTIFFCALEIIEIVGSGIQSYFSNLWNVMDWLNYAVFFLVYMTVGQYLTEVVNVPCSPLCERIGYLDDWQAMRTIRTGKFYLSLCVCIQLLKIIKFTSALVPKMDLAPSVLKKAFPDLVFFGIVFAISLFAFSTMLYIQLGPFIDNYATQSAAIISLSRSLFGDFDIDEIINNSSGYANTLLFITYLFVAVFIMLSMFFAILGESQANLRDDQRNASQKPPEYGVFAETYNLFTDKVLMNTPVIGTKLALARSLARAEEIEEQRGTKPTPVDRIEARQLELADRIVDITSTLQTLTEVIKEVQAGQRQAAQQLQQSGGCTRSHSSSRCCADHPTRAPSALGHESKAVGKQNGQRSSCPKDARERGAQKLNGGSKSRPARATTNGAIDSYDGRYDKKSRRRVEEGSPMRQRGHKLEDDDRRRQSVSPDKRLAA